MNVLSFPPLRHLAVVLSFATVVSSAQSGPSNAEVVVFGATPAGIMAAVAAGRAGHSVIVLEPSYLVGGMMSGGLTKTDVGASKTIGGLSMEFYRRVLEHYTKTYGEGSEQVQQTKGGFFFEPKVADRIFSEMMKDANVKVFRHEQLRSAELKNNRIVSITVENSQTREKRVVTGKIFIDATYEGDLLAAADVPYRVGREAREEYNESLAGMNDGPAMYAGKGDHRVQAYNMRSTLTNRKDILVQVPKPEFYVPEAHQAHVSAVLKHNIKSFEELFPEHESWGMVNGKCDPNRADAVGMNYAYVEGDYEQRARIVKRVQDYWLSLWYMLQNDERLPAEFRESAKRWGLPADEFEESGHVSPQIYVRTGRRMLGRHMLTEHDVDENRWKDDAICLGSYNFDSHVVQEILTPTGLKDEGFFIQATDDYEIPYRAITPFAPANLLVVCAVSATHVGYSTLRMEPVFMMIGHAAGIAATMAMEGDVPVQDVDTAALRKRIEGAGIPTKASFRPTVEIRHTGGDEVEPGKEVQFSVHPVRLETPLKKFAWCFDGSGQVQSTDDAPAFTFTQPGVHTVDLIVEDESGLSSRLVSQQIRVGELDEPAFVTSAEVPVFVGRWDRTRGAEPEYRKKVCFTDRNADKGTKTATYSVKAPRAGRYLIAQAYSAGPNRAAKVPVTVRHGNQEEIIFVNQKKRKEAMFAYQPLTEVTLEAGEDVSVEVSNRDTDGHVIADQIRLIWKGDA